MKIKLPNPIKMVKFIGYTSLADSSMSTAADCLLNKGNREMFKSYEKRAIEYAKKAGENRNEGLIQKILDKFFI